MEAPWKWWWPDWSSHLSKLSKVWTLKVLTKQHIPWSLVDVKAVCVQLRNRGNASSPFYTTLGLLNTKEQCFVASHFMNSFSWKQLLWLLPGEALGQNYTGPTWLMNQYPLLFSLHSLWPLALGMLEWGDCVKTVKDDDETQQKSFLKVKVLMQIHFW